MSKKETLERFDEKFVDKKYGGLKSIDDDGKIKQFITEEIKLAREETINEAIKQIEEVKDVIRKQTGAFKYDDCYDDCIKILNKLKKYETIRTI